MILTYIFHFMIIVFYYYNKILIHFLYKKNSNLKFLIQEKRVLLINLTEIYPYMY